MVESVLHSLSTWQYVPLRGTASTQVRRCRIIESDMAILLALPATFVSS